MRAAFWVSLVAVLAITAELLTHNHRQGISEKILDGRFMWSPEEGIQAIKSFTAQERQAYQDSFTGMYLGGDLTLPFAYALSMALFLKEKRSNLWLVPILAGMVDLVENFSVMYILRNVHGGLSTSDPFLRVAGTVATPLKWIGVVSGLLLCVAAGFGYGTAPAKSRKTKSI
ncbi:Hypothetical Protein FCC1311_060862 [Hondaea fermentalgiana]|uniref:Uncharacterized protein n=1 Tax=Hondaea fermentalgiana TaxID=2315210 RepID=A0A2R5GG29_9STRA|nr:Hypothetical Protein FCC1311_060862 [Hondaea fermentalgiana]|eukprot:GBG29866.1 Hypothetical Protein FCC1311_060862 [Hondaea fermentalgiana]